MVKCAKCFNGIKAGEPMVSEVDKYAPENPCYRQKAYHSHCFNIVVLERIKNNLSLISLLVDK